MACLELYATGKNSITLKSKDLATCCFQKIQDTPTKTRWSRTQFLERSAYPLQNYLHFSLLTSALESFGHKSTPSDRTWIEAYSPTVRKWAGPRMPTGRLSRVPWPGNSWMPFIFQLVLWSLQQPHEIFHTHSGQAIHTQLAHHYIQ